MKNEDWVKSKTEMFENFAMVYAIGCQALSQCVKPKIAAKPIFSVTKHVIEAQETVREWMRSRTGDSSDISDYLKEDKANAE